MAKILGIIGGGQLGMMLTEAAKKMPEHISKVIVLDPNEKQVVTEESILYKCGWSPFLGDSFSSKVKYTFVNGHLAYNDGVIDDTVLGKKIEFES
jgi:dihydroorotase